MKIFGTIALLTLSISCCGFGQEVRSRKSINELGEQELGDYIHAIQKLRERSAANPNDSAGYSFQAGLHNDPFIGPCEHGNDQFFPWHRAHLYYFEELLRASDPPRTSNVTIPYWDWIHPQENGKFPAAFAKEGLADPTRLTANTFGLPNDTLEIVTTERTWSGFGGFPKGSQEGNYGRLERGPHNYMHGFFIGGNMGDPFSAAEDPLYFSFHCFIDLMCAEWQRRNDSPAPTSPNEVLRGFSTQSKNKVSDFQDTQTLGYKYEYTQQLKTAFGVTESTPQPGDLVKAEPLKALDNQSFDAQLRSKEGIQFVIPPRPSTTKTALLRLQDLKVPTVGSYMVRAYVHPKKIPFAKDDETFKKAYFVGYVAMWKSHRAPEFAHVQHHPPSCTARFDVTKVLTKFTAEEAADLVLSLHIIPAPDPSGKIELKEELIKEIQLKDVMVEFYK